MLAGPGIPRRQRRTKGDMNGFTANYPALLQASGGYLDLQIWTQQIYRGLLGSCDTLGGMAGGDSAGNIFASGYDKAADAVVNGVGRVVGQLGGTSNGLYDTVMTYVRAEEDITSQLRQPYQLPAASSPDCDQSSKIIQLPSARGHASWPVSHIIAQFYPQGDPDKLQQAAEVWAKAATLLSTLADQGRDQSFLVIGSSEGSTVDSFQANWIKTQQAIQAMSNTANQISSACSIYSTKIRQLRAKLEHLLEAAGIAGGAALGLTVLTLGISDAAGAVAEGAIATDAAAAAATMTAELSSSAEVAVLAEAASVVDQAAAAMIPVEAASAAFSGGSGATTATLASYTMPPAPARYPYSGAIGPVPPPRPPLFPDLSPADQAAFREWMAKMESSGRTKATTMPRLTSNANTAAATAYQLRIAGNREYRLYTTLPEADNKTNRDIPRDQRDEATMWADGVRSQDGAAIDAKYVNKPNSEQCTSTYSLTKVGTMPDRVYQMITEKQDWEMARYASAVRDPRNHITHVEVDTNDNRASAYFRALMGMNGVPGQVRVIP